MLIELIFNHNEPKESKVRPYSVEIQKTNGERISLYRHAQSTWSYEDGKTPGYYIDHRLNQIPDIKSVEIWAQKTVVDSEWDTGRIGIVELESITFKDVTGGMRTYKGDEL